MKLCYAAVKCVLCIFLKTFHSITHQLNTSQSISCPEQPLSKTNYRRSALPQFHQHPSALIFSSFSNMEIVGLQRQIHGYHKMSVNRLFFSSFVHNCYRFVFVFQKPLQPDMGHNSLANFQIEKKIGRGQFSEVYRARYLLDNTSVALKKVQVRHSKRIT